MPGAHPTAGSSEANRAGATDANAETARVVLLAGAVTVPDRVGHHDYLAGCMLLASLLGQTPGVRPLVVRDGWPDDEGVFDGARALLVYSGGGRKLAFLQSPQRIARLQQAVDQGVGLVMIHQAVSYPPEHARLASGWIGGAHVAGRSARGHWRTRHCEFPAHPVTRGVAAWTITDGWLNQIQFTEGMRGVTPLVWAGPRHLGSSAGGAADVVAWAYERAGGGRSFCFSGLDAHSAWAAPGVRRLVVNGILWSAGLPVPAAGAPCAADAGTLTSYLTPRGSRGAWLGKVLRRGGRRLAALVSAEQAAVRKR
jgi:type 1 glutamine amidotransferase